MSLSRNQILNVLHIASGDLWAGAEVQLYTLLSQLQQRKDLTLHAVLLNEGELARRLRALGIPVTILDESLLNAWQILSSLRRLMLQLRPAIVHTHRIKENILGALANRLATGAASVRTVHGAAEHPAKGWRQSPKRLVAWLNTMAGRHLQDRVIAVSKGLQAPLATEFGANKVIVIENGIDISAVQAAIAPVDFRIQAPHACHIGIVGRLQPVKRVDIFLDMAALLIRTQPDLDWQFQVIGDGPLRQPLQQQAAELGIDDRVTFHGHRGDSVACLAGLDALVMCSDHEGMPMTLLETLTVGTPVLAHAVGGMADVLENSKRGVLVTEHSAPAYAFGLQQLLAISNETLRMTERADIPIHYSSAANAAKVSQLYLDIT